MINKIDIPLALIIGLLLCLIFMTIMFFNKSSNLYNCSIDNENKTNNLTKLMQSDDRFQIVKEFNKTFYSIKQ